MTLADKIRSELQLQSGRTDRALAEAILGTRHRVQQINGECRHLEMLGQIERRKVGGAPIENYLARVKPTLTLIASPTQKPAENHTATIITEDQVKAAVKAMLESNLWSVEVAWGRARGPDIVAMRGMERWVIECKGAGSLAPMQNNYFVSIIGELLQRMADDQAKRSIALPDLPKFRRLWAQLPALVKKSLSLSALFVSEGGDVLEVSN